jgi:hypothetical protein
MKILIIVFSLIIFSCGMSNEEIIKQKNICEKGGMDYDLLITIGNRARKVTCIIPKKGKD